MRECGFSCSLNYACLRDINVSIGTDAYFWFTSWASCVDISGCDSNSGDDINVYTEDNCNSCSDSGFFSMDDVNGFGLYDSINK